jgi:hypothetical protein
MPRFVHAIALTASLVMLLCSGAQAGGSHYERTYPARMIAIPAEARAYYVEFRARGEIGGFGHSYITLGAIVATGEMQETVVAGFMPKSADDDYWSQFGIRVTGLVGVVRSDFIRRSADVRFRIIISRAQYYRAVNTVYNLQKTWTTYDLLAQNCNNFAGEIANSLGLRTPMITVQYPVTYIAELRSLNAPLKVSVFALERASLAWFAQERH